MRLKGKNDQINRYVSIHASVKDATQKKMGNKNGNGFNPRICKRCDGGSSIYLYLWKVSIHASVKDATMMGVAATDRSSTVSIHASVKDATPCL